MIFINSCNVCVFYFCILSTTLDLLEATCSVISVVKISFAVHLKHTNFCPSADVKPT